MDIEKIIKERHSVREYLDKSIEEDKIKELNKLIAECNKEGNLNIQLVLNDRETFTNFFLNYGKIKASNYLAMIGKDDSNLEENVGYYGEKLVLKAQELELNTCWVSGTFNKKYVKAEIKDNEKIVCVIAIGYGKTNGLKRKIRNFNEISYSKDVPSWYEKGIEYALYAPSAINQQKYKFELINDNIVNINPGLGIANVKIDAGIAKLHFELGAGKENFTWNTK